MAWTSRVGIKAYIAVSYAIFFLYVLDYANAHREFLPTMVALTSSSLFQILLTNCAVASVLLLWIMLRYTFFVSMNLTESAAVTATLPIYLAESIIMPLYFNNSVLGVITIVSFATLVFRLLHRLAEERITTITVTVDPALKRSMTIRLRAFLTTAIFFDLFVAARLWNRIHNEPGQKNLVNVTGLLTYSQLLIKGLHTYATLAITLRQGEERTSGAFYLESLLQFMQSAVLASLFLYMWYLVEFPILMIRTFAGQVIMVIEKSGHMYKYYVLNQKIRHIPNATASDIERDPRCTICYDDMEADNSVKRLPCSHCYHVRCLTQWFEAHSTCPYCRADLMKYKPPAEAHVVDVAVDHAAEEPAAEPAAEPEAAAAAAEVRGSADPIAAQVVETLVHSPVQVDLQDAYRAYTLQRSAQSPSSPSPVAGYDAFMTASVNATFIARSRELRTQQLFDDYNNALREAQRRLRVGLAELDIAEERLRVQMAERQRRHAA